jgi:glycosyltransferase involved in cell wall biosynthesis
MQIAFPFVGDSVGGSHRSIIELYRELKKSEYSPRIVIHIKNGLLSKILEQENIPYDVLLLHKLAGETPNLLAIAYGMIVNKYRITKYIKENKIDIVHGNDLRINLTWSFATKLSQAKFVWHQRTHLSKSSLWKFIAFLCDHFIAISVYAMENVPRNLPSSRKCLVNNPFDTNTKYNRDQSRKKMIEEYKLPNNDLIVGYLGRFYKYKNVHILIEAFALVLENIHNVKLHLVLIGEGDKNYISYLHSLVDHLQIKPQVSFCGFHEKPMEAMAGVDIAVMLMEYEAFGRTLVEAMLQETAVVAVSAGGHKEIIHDNVTGVFYSPGNTNELVDKIKDLASSPDKRKKIAKNGYDEAVKRYGVISHSEAVLSIYRNLTLNEE